MAPSELQHLLHVLKERDVPLGVDDVAWAFENDSTKSAIQSWVREYTSPASLLTREELFLYATPLQYGICNQQVNAKL